MASARTPEYTYHSLKEVHENYQSYNQCNVYGVISDCFPVRKSRGKDYFCILRIIDESYSNGEGIKVSLFAPLAHSLPEVDQWDIIRLHRLKPSTYLGDLTFLSTKGWSFVMWPHNEDVNNGKSISENCTIHESDKERVRELRKWIFKSKVGPSKDISVSPTIQITDIKMNVYFNIKCQVVGMACIKDSLTILKVWDGTSPPTNISPIPCEDVEMVHLPTLPQISHLCIDMCVYDNHVDTLTQLHIAPGSHILITNLHAQQKSTAPLHIELYLHGGVVHNRGITLLDTNDQLKGDLQSTLGKFTNVQMSSKTPHPSGTTNTTNTSSSSGSSSLSVDASPVQLKKVEMLNPKLQQQERKYDELEPPVIPPTPPKVVSPTRGSPSLSRAKRPTIAKSMEHTKQSRSIGESSKSADGGVTPGSSKEQGSSKGQGSHKGQGRSTIEMKQNVGNSKISGTTNPPNDFVGISLERNISLADDNDSCEIEVSNVRSLCDVTEKQSSSISNKNKQTENSGKIFLQKSQKNAEFKEP
uniref:Protection of telomeres protein 1 n=2 Tax=Ciona intestinalis TaxID=7719 RepID=F6VBZ6_CIOIN